MGLVVEAWWFLIGSVVGSFLNVCIYRLPREESIVWPGSHCPHCQAPIRWHDNIPIVSFLALKGCCRNCQKPIHWRYPVVEALSGTAAVAVMSAFGVTARGAVYLCFVWALLVASFIDLEFQIIPDEISLGGLVLGLIVSPLVPQLHGTEHVWIAVKRSVVGALVGGGLLYGTGVLGSLVFRKEAMGGGDVKLLAMAGSLLGWKLVTLTFFLAPFLAVIPGVFVLVAKRSHVIPFGPFLSIALILSLFAGERILQTTGLEESLRILWMLWGWES